jgi:hypothetical protein
VRERGAALHVADRVDPRNIRLQPVVDGDVAGLVGRDARSAQIQAIGVRRAPDRDQEMASGDLPLPFRRLDQDLHAAVSRNAQRVRVLHDVDAVLGQDLLDLGRDVGVLARNQPVVARDDGDARAEAPEHLAELEPDVAAAENDQVRRQDLQFHDARRVEPVHVGEARDVRHRGATTGVDDDPVGGEQALATRVEAHAHGARINEAALAEHEIDRRHALEPALAAAPELLDHALLARPDLGEIDARGARMHAEIGAAPREIGDARGGDHRLGRGAADVDAGAADVPRFDDRSLAAGASQRQRERLAGLAGADDDRVELLGRHESLATAWCRGIEPVGRRGGRRAYTEGAPL